MNLKTFAGMLLLTPALAGAQPTLSLSNTSTATIKTTMQKAMSQSEKSMKTLAQTPQKEILKTSDQKINVQKKAALEKPTASEGGVAGGGGGAIKIGDKIYSMAQAGLEPAKDGEPFYVDFESLDRAKTILKSLETYCYEDLATGSNCGFKLREISERISEQAHIYRPSTIVDQKLYERMKADYQKFVDMLKLKGKFSLVAYTEGRTTTLFPDFLNCPEIDTRAIYLIHEALFVNNGYLDLSLEQVLRIESAVVSMLSQVTVETVRELNDSLVAYQSSVNGGSEKTTNSLYVVNYLMYLKQKNIVISLDQLIGHGEETLDNVFYFYSNGESRRHKFVEISNYELSKNRSIDADFFKIFFGKSVGLHNLQLTFKAQSKYLISDLEFRGTALYSKTTNEVVIKLIGYEGIRFDKTEDIAGRKY